MEYQEQDFIGFDAGNRSVVRNNAISRDARLLFVILNSFASTKRGCFIGNERLAFYLGADERSVRRWITELKNTKAIDCIIVNKNERFIKITSEITVNGMDSAVLPPGHQCPTPPDTSVHIGNRVEGIELGNTPIPPRGDRDEYLYNLDIFWKAYPKEMRRETKGKVLKTLKAEIRCHEDFEKLMKAIEWKKKRLEGYKPLDSFEPNFPYPCKFIKTYELIPEPLNYKQQPRTPVGGFKSTAAILAQEKQTEADKRRQQALFDKAVGLRPRGEQLAEQRWKNEWSKIAETKDANNDPKPVENIFGKLLGLQP